MPPTPEQIDELLEAEESEALERKKSIDNRRVKQAIIAFANDQADRERGWLILGQAPDKEIIGLKGGADEIQRKISDIARTQCFPAIPISIEVVERQGKQLAIVEVRRSHARPHFEGRSWVRMGSTTRQATDAEVTLMRAAESDRKVALVSKWFNEGRTEIKFWVLPAPGSPLARSPETFITKIEEVTSDWIVIDKGGRKMGIPFIEFNVGYDPHEDRLVIRYHGAPK